MPAVATSLEPEYGSGYLDPWGYITHSETIGINQSQIFSGNKSLEEYRRRGYTHTLSISGALQYCGNLTIREQKDRLTEYISNMRDRPSNFVLPINAGFFPSIIANPEDVIFEPINISFEGGTLIDNLKYEVQFVFNLYPQDNEIKEISIFGILIWDRSQVTISKSYDRAKKSIINNITVSGSIKSPDNMSWSKALTYYNAVDSLQSQVNDNVISSIQLDKNIDDQTISYSISGSSIDDNSIGDINATVNIFGFTWSIHGTIQLENRQSKIPISIDEGDQRVVVNNSIPFIETLSYNLNVSAPNDVGLISSSEGPNLPSITLMDMYANARSIRPGQFLTGVKQATTSFTGWTEISDPSSNVLWEIQSSTASYDPLNKSLGVSIVATRARNTSLRKNIGFNGSDPFLWDGCQISYNSSNDGPSFIFNNSVSVNGSFKTPDDMTSLQGKELVDEMLNLSDFDDRYRGYKLVSKSGGYDPISQNGTFNLSFQKIDLYSFFDDDGNPRTPRSCLWSFGIFDDITDIQVEVSYNQSASIDENRNTITELSVDLSIRQDPRSFTENNTSIELAFEQLWQKFIINKTTLQDGVYRLNSSRRTYNSSRLEGQMSLSFTDDGEGIGNTPFVNFYDIILNNAKYSYDLPKMRFSTLEDGFSNGDFAQKHGLGSYKISLTGQVKSKYYDTINPPVNKIYSSEEYQKGFLYIAGFYGRIETLNINPDPVRKTADINVSIISQPMDEIGVLKSWDFSKEALNSFTTEEINVE